MGRKAVLQKVPEPVFLKEPPPEIADELDEVAADADAADADDTLVGDNIGEHRAILDAIRARNPARARSAMRRHLANAERQRLALLRKRA